jgi:[acyl-carrier-protein] S-malonyltransferase
LATEAGAKRVIPLNVSGAFHSPLMEAPAAAMAKALAGVTFRPGKPAYSNVLAAPVHDASLWPELLARQLRAPVRWTETVRATRAAGVEKFVEFGVGETLSGLIRRTDKDAETAAIFDMITLQTDV